MGPEKQPAGRVVLTRDGGGRVYDQMSGFRFEWLLQTERFEMLRVDVDPGAETGTMVHPGEEAHHILEGDLEIVVEGETHRLGAGDTFWHESSRPHRWRNPTGKSVRVLSVAVPRTSVSKMIGD